MQFELKNSNKIFSIKQNRAEGEISVLESFSTGNNVQAAEKKCRFGKVSGLESLTGSSL